MDYIAANIDLETLYNEIKCNADTIYRFNGVWEGPNPLKPIVPLFLVQLTIAVVFTRLLIVAISPLNQPPFVAEIVGGVLLGPSAFGKFDVFKHMLFPTYYLQVLEPIAHYALVFYAFLMGLQMDVRAISRTGTHSMHVAVAGIFIPMIIGSTLYFIVSDDPDDLKPQGSFFWGAALSVTGFSVLAKLLDKQKLLLTDIGKTALSSALLSDMSSWFLLVIGLAITVKDSIWIILCTVTVVLIFASYVRPALDWIIRKTPAGQGYSEYYICSIISGVSLMGVITDLFGTHPMIGAFLFGLIIPNDVLQSVLLDRLGDFVHGILMPIFFMVCGLRTNIDDIGRAETGTLIKVVVVILLAFSAKIMGAVTVAFFHDSDTGEAVAIGILNNTKSTIALVILEIGITQGALTSKTYSLMIVALLFMTMIVTPASTLYRPSKNLIPYKRRTIQKARSDEELRILTCLYDTKNIPPIINLLEISNSTQRSPINVFALHVVELIGRASAMLIVHTSHRSGPRHQNYLEAQTDQILTAFDNFELRSEGVHTQVLTARSAYATMDEHICNIASDKRAAIIILPFHRLQTQDGEMEDMNPSAQNVNESVMAKAPCSVGILFNRGLVDLHNQARKIAVLFFGGPDDREALVYAWRMAEHADTKLRVVRFIPSQGPTEVETWDPMESIERDEVAIHIDSKRDRALDDDLLNKFKISTVNDSSIRYSELVLDDEEEAVRAIKRMDSENHDLYVVGKGRGVISPLTAGLTDWCDCPELGPIGDLLVTSEFESSFSVLVLQQYLEPSTNDTAPGDSLTLRKDGKDVDFRLSTSESETMFEPFASFRKRDPYSDH